MLWRFGPIWNRLASSWTGMRTRDKFRDLDVHFESTGTGMRTRDKFRDSWWNLLYIFHLFRSKFSWKVRRGVLSDKRAIRAVQKRIRDAANQTGRFSGHANLFDQMHFTLIISLCSLHLQPYIKCALCGVMCRMKGWTSSLKVWTHWRIWLRTWTRFL